MSADNASSGLFVIGASSIPLADTDLRPVQMQVTDATGAVVSRGRGADCLGDPVAALALLARTAAGPQGPGQHDVPGPQGRPERPMVAVTPGGHFTAEIGRLGNVQTVFTTS